MLFLLLLLFFRATDGDLISVIIKKGRRDSWHEYGKEVTLVMMSMNEQNS